MILILGSFESIGRWVGEIFSKCGGGGLVEGYDFYHLDARL